MKSLSLPPAMRSRGVTAVLGPTNTGKTHLAIERMAAHSSGLIGLPLRLLAREVYGRLVDKVGLDAVALITGEEKIKPSNPRYWVATVEAMPRDLDVAFVAVDEIQLAMDFDRGHVFTDHLLNRRGREETLLLGSSTMKPILEVLIPGIHITTRPRLSKLTFAGERKLTRLPPRSAIVAFSADEVYAIAELIRRQRGGAAVVLGALSPRTRNAQVDMYQAGDVDHIIATDAIGMGLNLDIHHVAFAGDSKFDGHYHRRLTASEFGQIAGRAGRHLRDGTFGTSGRCRPFDPQLIEDLENHVFDPVRVINWRSPDLDFRSVDALRKSLAVTPEEQGLVRAPRADDETVFDIAASAPEVRQRILSRDGVTRLWDVSSLPDYRKVAPHAHAEMVAQIFGFLSDKGSIPEDWFQRQVNMCDRIDGDIDTLSARIAQTRTWTFCANRDWLHEPVHWQAATRAIEDKLSDALHERLTARFVDRRTSVLMRRLRENAMLEAEIGPSGDVIVEGQPVGRLQGFRFTPEAGANGPEAKALAAAAVKALASEIETRAEKLSQAADDAFVLALDGALRWIGEPVAKLQASEKILEPRFLILADDQLSGSAREKVEARLTLWLKAHVQKLLGALLVLESGEGLEGIARGIAYQLAEHLGVLDRTVVQAEVKNLDQNARAALRKLGVRFGAYHITTPMLLKPAPRALAAQLWVLKHGGVETKGLDDIAHLSSSGRTSIPVDEAIPKALYRAAGYRVAGPRAIRVDILERLADLIRPAIAFRPGQTPGEPPAGAFSGDGFTVTGAMTSLAGCAGEDFAAVLKGLGYRSEKRPPMPAYEVVPIVVSATIPLAVEAAMPASELSADTEAAADAQIAETVAPEAEAPEISEQVAAAPVSETLPVVAEVPTPEVIPVESAAPDADGAVPSAETVTAEPVLVEVWRVQRFDRDAAARHRGRDRARTQQRNRSDEGAAVTAEGTAQAPARPRPGGKPWQKRDRKDEATGNAAPGFQRGPRPENRNAAKPERDRPGSDRKRGERAGTDGRKGSKDRDGFKDRKQQDRNGPRQWSSTTPPQGQGKQPDPNSPFAQLAALKARLEGKE